MAARIFIIHQSTTRATNALPSGKVTSPPVRRSPNPYVRTARVIEAAVIRGMLEGQHRAVDACKEIGETEQVVAHKVATAIREKNDLLIVNLSSLR